MTVAISMAEISPNIFWWRNSFLFSYLCCSSFFTTLPSEGAFSNCGLRINRFFPSPGTSSWPSEKEKGHAEDNKSTHKLLLCIPPGRKLRQGKSIILLNTTDFTQFFSEEKERSGRKKFFLSKSI